MEYYTYSQHSLLYSGQRRDTINDANKAISSDNMNTVGLTNCNTIANGK